MVWGADAPDFARLVKLYGAVSPAPMRYAPPDNLKAALGVTLRVV